MSKKLLLMGLALGLTILSFSQPGAATFTSTDTALQRAFDRAKMMALSYRGQPGDPVGDWYESALPPRYAFCMRDVAHQSIAGEILGLGSANKNMMGLFAANISDSKDWCSYWEINKYGKPAPADYRNDTAFWYNLNANFDIMNACWKLYLWTGDTTYIAAPQFKNFYQRSMQDFIQRWQLEPELLLSRPAYPNAAPQFNEADDFNRCRGLPSYSEGVTGIKMGIDLVAAIYRAMCSYAALLQWQGLNKEAMLYLKKAQQYQQHIDKYWWDDNAQQYNTYYSKDNQFGKTEGETFLFWFDALNNGDRKQKTLQRLAAGEWNVENLSYFPLIMYQHDFADKGYQYILHLTDPATKRREYPEVSFGVLKGIVEGVMGLEADARYNRISTLHRGSDTVESTIANLPVLGTVVSLTHTGNRISKLHNKGNKTIVWRASFNGAFKQLYKASKRIPAKQEQLLGGKTISWIELSIGPGKVATVDCKPNL